MFCALQKGFCFSFLWRWWYCIIGNNLLLCNFTVRDFFLISSKAELFNQGYLFSFLCSFLHFLKTTEISSFFFWLRGMRDLSSLTRDQTHTPCSGSAESYPVECQGSPTSLFYWNGSSSQFTNSVFTQSKIADPNH